MYFAGCTGAKTGLSHQPSCRVGGNRAPPSSNPVPSWAARPDLQQLGLVEALHHQLPQGVDGHAGDLRLASAAERRQPRVSGSG